MAALSISELEAVPLQPALTRVREALAANDDVIAATSGTTVKPRLVRLTADAVRASAEASLQALGGPGQWMLALPRTRIGGFAVLVRSLALPEHPPVSGLSDDGHFDPGSFLRAATTMTAERRYCSLVPVQLTQLLRYVGTLPESDRVFAERVLQRFDVLLVGGQRLAERDLAAARDLDLRVIRSYGSTETGSGCVYDGVPLAGTEVRLGDDNEILVASPSLAAEYVDDPELTAARFVEHDGLRWFRTRDIGSFSDGVLSVTGRADRAFTSGGVTVMLDAVEALVTEQLPSNGAVVLATQDETWGERAVLVLERAVSDEEFSNLCLRIKTTLGSAAVPIRRLVVEEIPRNHGGKPDYQAIKNFL